VSDLAKAREAIIQAAQDYGREVAELSLSIVVATEANARDACIAVVSRRIAQQARKLVDEGASKELAELWIGVASAAATEQLKEIFPFTSAPKPSVH
jgi:hypothetical protein